MATARPGTKSYDAFISYAHAQDEVLASALERDVRRFARPWNRQWAIRVYRDESNLSVSPDLWGKVQSALLDSHYLILLASPEAAKSKWVVRELDKFLDSQGPDKLLIVLTAGEIAWDDRTRDFDWRTTTAIPRQLAGRLSAEPKFLDLRWCAGRGLEQLRGGKWQDAIADLSSVLQDKPKDELYGEDARQRRTQRVIVGASIAALVIAPLLTIGVSTYFSLSSQNTAQERIYSQTQQNEERSLNMLHAEGAMDQGDYTATFEYLGKALQGARDESYNAIQVWFDTLLRQAMRDDPAFELAAWSANISSRWGSRETLYYRPRPWDGIREKVENPLAYMASIHAMYTEAGGAGRSEGLDGIRYIQRLIDRKSLPRTKFSELLGTYSRSSRGLMDESGFVWFREKGECRIVVKNGRIFLEMDNTISDVDPVSSYTLTRVNDGILYAQSGSSNTLTPGVAFRGFDGDVVLIMFDVYSYQFDSESMSYKIEQAFMHNENDYWMDICRRR